MKNSLITVIIPTHNSQRFVRECVESVMNQTHKNLQIVCVDSSHDNTMQELLDLQNYDKRIEIIQDSNGSYGHKLNVGIRQARGEYIAIVESDDFILPEMYESMLTDVKEQVDYIKCNGTNNFADIKEKRIFYPEYFSEMDEHIGRCIDLGVERELAFVCLPRIWTALYRKEFLLENNIWANETPGASFQDTSFTQLVAILAKKCIYKRGAFYCYRNDNPESSVKSESKICCVKEEYEYLEKVLKSEGKYTEEVKHCIQRLKLGTYAWNIQRLNLSSATVFRNAVKLEMETYGQELLHTYSDIENYLFKIITDEEVLIEWNSRVDDACRCWRNMLNAIDGKQVVLIGAGVIGKSVLWMQDVLEKNIIVAIGDNNAKEKVEKIGEYNIYSVEEVVKAYTDANFLIANRHDGEEIKEQLRGLGVEMSSIICLRSNLDELRILGECIKYYA